MTVLVPAIDEGLLRELLVRLTEQIAKTGAPVGAGVFGGAYGYGADYSNDVFMMRTDDENAPDCDCGKDTEGTEEECTRECAANRPNFKCGEFEVRWHKAIGRSMDASGPELSILELVMLFDRCAMSVPEPLPQPVPPARTITTAAARRYVYRVLAQTLEQDIRNAEWLYEHPVDKRSLGEDDPSHRRIARAAAVILDSLRKRASE